MVMDRAHIVGLNRFTGAVLWDTEMADWKLNYNATSAPLVVGDLVISGIAGGDEGVRGFVAAFDQSTGKGGVAILDRPQERQSLFRKPGKVPESSIRRQPHGSPAVTTRSLGWCTGRREIRVPITTATNALVTTSIRIRRWPSMPRPEN